MKAKTKCFNDKEKLSAKQFFLLENILNSISNKETKEKVGVQEEKPKSKESKPKDFKVEIETRFLKSQNQKYIFPKQIMVSVSDNDSSLESLKDLGTYNLNEQNQKYKISQPSYTSKLIDNIQRKKQFYEMKQDFSEKLSKMKRSLQEKLKNQALSKKYNNFVEETHGLRNNCDNKNIQNLSDRIIPNNNPQMAQEKKTRTSFSKLHSSFNRSLQQNAQTLNIFFKKPKNSHLAQFDQMKKAPLFNFFQIQREKPIGGSSQHLLLSPKSGETKQKIEKNSNLEALIAKKLYRKIEDGLINQTKSRIFHTKDENPNSDNLRKERNTGKLQNLSERNKDNLNVISTNKQIEFSDFLLNKINKSCNNVSSGKLRQKQKILNKEIKGYSNYPSFNSSNSYSSQKFKNSTISTNTKNV